MLRINVASLIRNEKTESDYLIFFFMRPTLNYKSELNRRVKYRRAIVVKAMLVSYRPPNGNQFHESL